MRVRVQNLVNAPSYNGLVGTLGKFLVKSNRWEIELDERPGMIQEIEEKNISVDGVKQRGVGLESGVRVKIVGLKAMPHYNGLYGSLIKYRDDIDKWVIMLD